MIISISGVPGSGKTTLAKLLAERLNVPFYSVGGLRGKMAMERGLTIDQLNALGEQDKTTDTSVDDYQRELGRKEKDFVIEGRLSWHFIPHSFKVFLYCDPKEAARRILESKHERPDEALPDDLDQAAEIVKNRMASDARRYQTIYGLDYLDKAHYDLYLDVTRTEKPEHSAEKVFKALNERLAAETSSDGAPTTERP